MSDTFKVRVTGACHEHCWYKNKIGQKFDVQEYSGNMVTIKTGSGIYKSDCEIVEDNMETYKVNGVTYGLKKDITVKALILAHARDADVLHFIPDYPYFASIPLKVALDYADSFTCKDRIQWLVKVGLTEVVEEEAKHLLIMNVYEDSGVSFWDGELCVLDASLVIKNGRGRISLDEFDYYKQGHNLIFTRK